MIIMNEEPNASQTPGENKIARFRFTVPSGRSCESGIIVHLFRRESMSSTLPGTLTLVSKSPERFIVMMRFVTDNHMMG
jgi:hypothetical protein